MRDSSVHAFVVACTGAFSFRYLLVLAVHNGSFEPNYDVADSNLNDKVLV